MIYAPEICSNMPVKTQNPSQEFAEDFKDRINPDLMNRLLYRSVPVLKHTGWKITKVGMGMAETLLPLNAKTTNQHGTHQAALISLSADYTGGMALTSLLTGVPLSGIHKCIPEDAVSLWLASMNVKYINPSTGHLKGFCKIDPKTADKIRSRYFQGKRVLVTLPMEFTSNGQKIAEAELKYFAQPTIQLLSSDRPSPLFNQKIKASARMIAGVRATKDPEAIIRVDCPHAERAAGPHGEILAKRLRSALPQLPDMVLARTRHLDQTIEKMEGVEQIVMLGAGLDMRPFRISKQRPDIKFFEVDLPPMVEERSRVIEEMSDDPQVFETCRYSISADFLKDDVAEEILKQSPFNSKKKTLFTYEGCSMYFDLEQNKKVLSGVCKLAQHPESQFWCDFVTSSVVNGETDSPEVVEFLKRMDNMGEAFVFGIDNPSELLESIGCESAETTSCREFLGTDKDIFNVYQFCVGYVGDGH